MFPCTLTTTSFKSCCRPPPNGLTPSCSSFLPAPSVSLRRYYDMKDTDIKKQHGRQRCLCEPRTAHLNWYLYVQINGTVLAFWWLWYLKYLFVYLSVRLSVCPSFCLYVCLSVCLLSACLPVSFFFLSLSFFSLSELFHENFLQTLSLNLNWILFQTLKLSYKHFL